MTRVLPEPAPARISSGPSVCSTASRCSGFSLSRKVIAEFQVYRSRSVSVTATSHRHGRRATIRFSPMPATLFKKVWDAHTVRKLPNGQTQLFIGLHLIHEVTT